MNGARFKRRKWRPNKHDGVVLCLEERLLEKGTYRRVDSFVEYEQNGLQGEFDVIAETYKGSVCYYEVKSRFSIKSYKRALAQFERARKAFPELQWRFVYYSPEHVLRVRL